MERRLGRGLGSLLGQTQPAGQPEAAAAEEPQQPPPSDPAPKQQLVDAAAEWLDVSSIRRNPEQPRTTFDREALEELQDSIKRHGVLQPICVRRAGDGFEIVSGERRWRAARSAGLTRMPAVVREDMSDEVSLELAIVENVQRQDLHPLERARGYQALMEKVGLTQEKVAERVGIARATVTNHLRLLDLPKDAQEAISSGLITMGHAKALLAIKGKKEVLTALARIVREDLSVRAAEAIARPKPEGGASTDSKVPEKGSQPAAWVTSMEARLREALGVRASLKNGKGYRGTLQLDYSSREELERICELLAPEGRLE